MERQHSAFLSDALVVGWPEIDAQHEQIFAFLETLKSSCFGSRCLPMEGFRRLVMDFEQHFTDEERLAAACGLGCPAHEVAHQDTLRTIRGSLQGGLVWSGRCLFVPALHGILAGTTYCSLRQAVCCRDEEMRAIVLASRFG